MHLCIVEAKAACCPGTSAPQTKAGATWHPACQLLQPGEQAAVIMQYAAAKINADFSVRLMVRWMTQSAESNSVIRYAPIKAGWKL